MNETPPAEEIFGSLAPDKSKATYGRAWDDFVLFLSIGEYVADDTSAPGCEEDDLEKENGNLPLTAAPLDKFEWWLADDPDPPLEAEKHPDVFRLVDPFSTCC